MISHHEEEAEDVLLIVAGIGVLHEGEKNLHLILRKAFEATCYG